MRRVAAEDDPALHETLGDGGVHLPATDAPYLDFEVGLAHRGTNPALAVLFLIDLVGPLFGGDRDLAQPPAAGVEWLEDTRGVRVDHEQQHPAPVGDVFLDVCMEVQFTKWWIAFSPSSSIPRCCRTRLVAPSAATRATPLIVYGSPVSWCSTSSRADSSSASPPERTEVTWCPKRRSTSPVAVAATSTEYLFEQILG